MTVYKNLEEALRSQLLSERVLKNISKEFVDTDLNNFDNAFVKALSNINDFLESDCTCFCVFNDEGFVEDFFYQCNLNNYNSVREFVDDFIFSSTSWWFEKFSADGYRIIVDAEDIPKEFERSRESFRKSPFSRGIVFPVRSQERLVGFVFSGAKKMDRSWKEAEVKVVEICGQMFINALNQKKMKEEVFESKERFDMAVRGAYLGLYDWDIVTGEVIFNDIWFRMLGYSPSEFPHTHDTWKNLIYEEDRERVLKSMTKYLNSSNAFYSEEYRLKTRDGECKWVHAQGRVVDRDENGRPLRMIGLQRDITEFRLMANDLAHQRDLFSLLIKNIPVGIFVKDVKDNFRIIIWNKYMENIFGITRGDVIGKNDHDLFDSEFANFYLIHDKRLVQTRHTQHIPEERIQTPDGEKWVHTIKVPIFNEKNEVVFLLGIMEDITERQQLEVQLRHTQKMKSIGQLAAGIAHEVKNPLAIILLAAEGLALNESFGKDEKVTKKIKMIKESAKKADDVIKELLKFSRLADPEMCIINLHQIINDAYFLAKNRSKEKNIEFKKDYYKKPIVCYGNSVLLEQVFINLINNAIDAIEESGKIIVRTFIKESLINKKEVVIEFEDNGPGIPDEVAAKIFDPFYTTKKVGLGTGLGLSTVFMIIEKHNGTIKLKSKKGEGTTFIITLPFWDRSCDLEKSPPIDAK